jgi:hypothetical protein
MRNRGRGAQHYCDAEAAGRLVALQPHGDIGDRPVERQLVGFAQMRDVVPAASDGSNTAVAISPGLERN